MAEHRLPGDKIGLSPRSSARWALLGLSGQYTKDMTGECSVQGTISLVASACKGGEGLMRYLDGCDDEQVLQVVIVGERRVLEDNLLQELDELRLKPSCHERLDCHADLLRVLALRQGRGDHL